MEPFSKKGSWDGVNWNTNMKYVGRKDRRMLPSPLDEYLMLNLTTETVCQSLCSWDLNIPPIHILSLRIPSARPHSCGLFSLKIAHSTRPFMQARRTLTTHHPQRNGKKTLCGPASRTKAPAPATQEQPLANSLQQRLLLSPVLELEPFSGPKHLQWLYHSCHFYPKTHTKKLGGPYFKTYNHPSPYLVHSHGILVMWEMARRNDLKVYGLALLVGRMSWLHVMASCAIQTKDHEAQQRVRSNGPYCHLRHADTRKRRLMSSYGKSFQVKWIYSFHF